MCLERNATDLIENFVTLVLGSHLSGKNLTGNIPTDLTKLSGLVEL